jgi:peptide/nickel transport system permease protein
MKYTFILRRLLSVVPVLLIITFATFALMQLLPGGPLAAYENNPEISQKDIERLRHEMGLDQPVHVQYWAWLKNFAQGDWGYSFTTKRPVLVEIWDRLPNTLYLTGISLIVALIIAIPAGIISATRQYSVFDHLTTTLAYIGRSMPVFYSGLLLIIIFSIWLRWLPSGGMHTLGKEFSIVDSLRHLFLPVLSLSTLIAAKYVRFLRTSMLEVIHLDYIRSAAAKGLSERAVIFKHALRNALLPTITLLGLQVPYLISGSVIIERIFNVPGMGLLRLTRSARLTPRKSLAKPRST